MAIELLRVMHVNLNCTDLARSLAWYRHLGLEPTTHTNPEPQDGSGFGLAGSVQWDAYILHDHRGAAGGPAIDLLQWLHPSPTGGPRSLVEHLGWSHVVLRHPEPSSLVEGEGSQQPDGRWLHDPDGVPVRVVRGDGPVELMGVCAGVRDLDASVEWYTRVLGLEELRRGDATAPSGVVAPSAHLALAGDDGFVLELVAWPQPAPDPVAVATDVGLYRMAFIVERIEPSHAALVAAGTVEASPPVFLDMGPDVPVDGVWAVFFPDPDGTCLELIAPS